MANRKTHKYACDFETTVYKGQENTEVWSAAMTEIFGEDEECFIFNNLDSFMLYLFKNHTKNIQYYYFHNLKFDGEFIIYWLMTHGFIGDFSTKKTSDMKSGTYNCIISEQNQWYMINIKYGKSVYQIRDSLKLLPFSLRAIGKSFKTKHQKLDMNFGDKRPGYIPTDDEKEYIKNDVYVLREALEIMFSNGYNGLTISSCCMQNFKKVFHGFKRFQHDFPNLEEVTIDASFGDINADAYIRRSYRGGWCYTRFENYNTKEGNKGVTADVNSLYPSVMHSISGSYYPIGKPHFWKGNTIPGRLIDDKKRDLNDYYYFFIRFECSFELRKDYLPFVQIKDSLYYPSTKMLKSSQIYDKYGTPLQIYDWRTGIRQSNKVTLTMTCVDFRLFLEHYKVSDFKILDGVWFYAVPGIFDDYIDYYMNMKIEASKENDPVKRELAKLSLNSLYGRFAQNSDSSYKIPYIDDETECTEFSIIDEHEKTPGFIAIGSAITSWARDFTIRAAQKNYHSFRYADTDSIHLELEEGEEVKGIKIHETDMCCWKLESHWNKARFVRAKTYIEYSSDEDEYTIRCAGLPQHCKNLLEACLRANTEEDKIAFLKSVGEDIDTFSKKEKEFIEDNYSIEDFKNGMVIPGKLMPIHIPGGVLLKKVNFTIK